MSRPASPLAILPGLALLLAGCSGGEAPATGPEDEAPLGEGLPTVSLSSIEAPAWAIGQWWEWEISFGSETRPDTFCSIVVAADSSTYTLATENTDWAKEEAAFDHALLGPARKPDLTMTGPDGDWSLLSFPLTDGKTWTASIPNVAWDIFLPADRVDVAMTARFVSAASGEQPKVQLTGKSGDLTLLEGEYDPATGWFSSLRFYDVDPGQEELEVGFSAKSTGLNYTGPYFQHTAQLLVAFEDLNGFSGFPTEGGQPYTQAPQPYHTFTMGQGTTLYGYVGAASFGGARGLMVVDPANNQRNVAVPGAPEGEQFLFFDEPGQAGEWRIATAGAGGFSGAFAELYEVTEGSFTM